MSEVYMLLKKFPKGGNIHLHHNHVVSKQKMLELIFSSFLYDHLYVKASAPAMWNLDFFLNPPQGWNKVKDNPSYSKDILVKHATLLGVIDMKATNNPTNSDLRWEEMNPLFGVLGSNIINHANFSKIYMNALLQQAMDENVQYLETKSSSSNKLYVLDPARSYLVKNGKRFIDNDLGELELQFTNEVVQKFKQNNPNFVGYKRIINSYRGKDEQYILKNAKKALTLFEKYPDLVSGFDLVAEEDKGYSLLFYLDDFAKMAAKNVSLPYFFHTGETNWPDDLLSSPHNDDPVPTMGNVYDAILLGAKRVGHGIGYVKHPYLMEVLKKKNIAIEVNPTSNKMLGYVADQRHHPAITYLRYGIPIVLGSDDPATFGYDEFTVDWYEAFMSWGLNLADLRHLAFNSLRYSSLSSSEKNVAYQKWKVSYDSFILNTKTIACKQTFQNTSPHIFRIFPQESDTKGGTKIQVFGRNFHVAICKKIICKFGDMKTKGTFVYSHRIICHSPDLSHGNTIHSRVVPLTISLDGGLTYIQNTFTFSYFQNNHLPIPDIFG
ncbi:CECR1 [Mytilus coruscus]|uniref:CECR1 n=1 Tax=Mytilus coruscus TaxID=42192 RepID=A0A6J8D8E7_MYTCO|nr:CECR1 [Mytilus coruscus]